MKTALLFFLVCSIAHAEHREHGAHVHGAAKMDIAFDGLNGAIEYDGAGMNIIGFEHAAKTAADKKTLTDSLKKFETKIEQIVTFDANLHCKYTSKQVELEKEGEHSDVNGHFKITCEKSPVNSTIKIDFSKDFPTLKKLNVQVLADAVQKSVSIDAFPAQIEVKP